MNRTHKYTIANVPRLKYKLIQTTRSGAHQIQLNGHLVGRSNADMNREKGTMVCIFVSSPGSQVVVSVHQWQRREDAPRAEEEDLLVREEDFVDDSTFEPGFLDELQAFFASEDASSFLPVVIERPFPHRNRLHRLAGFLAGLPSVDRAVGYWPVHSWETWRSSFGQGKVLHMMDTTDAPPIALSSLQVAYRKGSSPLLVGMSPDLWNRIRVWQPELGSVIRTFPTPSADPPPLKQEGPVDRFSKELLEQLGRQEEPAVRHRSYVRTFPSHDRAYMWLCEEGNGRMGRSSEEAWEDAVSHVPEFRNTEIV